MSRTDAPMRLRVRDYDFEHNPRAYARHLARYITNASTIRAHTLRNFGRAPDLTAIQDMMAEAAEARKPVEVVERYGEEPSSISGIRWKPRGLVNIEPVKPEKPAPQAMRPAEPVKAIPVVSEVPRKPDRIVTSGDVVATIAHDYGFSVADVLRKDRRRETVKARNACAHALKQRGNSFPAIGRILGGRDHSTIIHGIYRFEKTATEADWAIVRQAYRGGAA